MEHRCGPQETHLGEGRHKSVVDAEYKCGETELITPAPSRVNVMNTITELARTLGTSERSASYLFSIYAAHAALDTTRQADRKILIPGDHFSRIVELHNLSVRYALSFAGVTRMLLDAPVEVSHQAITLFAPLKLRDPEQRATLVSVIDAGRSLLGELPLPPHPASPDQGADLLGQMKQLRLDLEALSDRLSLGFENIQYEWTARHDARGMSEAVGPDTVRVAGPALYPARVAEQMPGLARARGHTATHMAGRTEIVSPVPTPITVIKPGSETEQ